MTGTELYNAGTEALGRGDLGEAVLFLRAATRLEPRAGDVERNLAIAEARVALARGESPAGIKPAIPLGLSSGEGWFLASALVALGIVGLFVRWKRLATPHLATTRSSTPTRGRMRIGVLDIAGILGLAAMAWLLGAAAVSTLAPEAVVMEASLPLTAASGQSLPDSPALVAGERVRLGPEREGLVEIRLGGTSVGWVHRAGVWRVRDAARYTHRSATEGNDGRGGSNG